MSSSSRAPVIDALRGIALFGIVAVNIQSFVGGIESPPLGALTQASSAADKLTLLLTAFLLEYKFYPIFCFCFGYGFAVQSRQWIARGLDARALFLRRTNFMLVLGVLHGIFIWFGDILSRYALAAYVLRGHIGKGPKKLLGLIRFWLFLYGVLVVIFAALMLVHTPDAAERQAQLDASTMAINIYTNGTWLDITLQRAKDYGVVTLSFLMVFPQVMVLFFLGAITAHMGWLRNVEKSRAFWWRVLFISAVIGVPVNLLYTYSAYWVAHTPLGAWFAWHSIAGFLLPFMAAAYVAAAALIAPSRFGRRLIALFAPAGRFALSNYIAESLLLSFLLYGYGAGWGKAMRQADLFLLASALYILLLVASHLYARTGRAGPLEALWRRYVGAKPTSS